MATNKEIAIKVIKEEFPSISEQGINALLANIEIETGFKKFVEIPQDYDKVMANSDLKSMQKNLKSLKGGKKAYDKLSNKEKLGVLYQGDKNAKYAGGIGGLQLTAANYGGLQDFEKQIDGIAATLNMSPEDLYNKAKTDPATAIRLSLVHLRDVKGVDVQELNVTDGKSLRKNYINPYESQGVETAAQAARDTIFNSYTPRVLSSSTDIEQPITAEDKLTQTRQKQKDKEALLNSKYKLTSEEEEEVKNAAIETASDIQARIERGELDGSDDEIKNLYFEELAKKIGVVDIDVNDADALSRARGFIEHATSISNEELGEQVGGDQFWDSKIEDALENWSNNVNWNLEHLGIPKKGQLTVNEPLFTGSVSVPGSVSTESEPQETPPDVQLKDIVKQDSKLVEEAVKTGLTAEQLADKKLQEKKYPNRSLDEAAQNLEDLDIQEEEEEEESMKSLGLKEDGTPLKPTDTGGTDDNKSKISGAEKALTGLKAAAGILSLSQALRAPDVETPEISPLVTEALHKQKALAESGMTAKEKGAAMQNLNDAYAGAMKNVLRASGGQRGMFLANQGTVDANRIKGLNQLAAQDAALHRQNVQQYNQLASSVGSMKLSRDMNVEQMRQATLQNNRQILSGVGSNLLSDAISDVSYYMNPNREKTQALLDQLTQGQKADTGAFDSSVGTANTNYKNQKQVNKDQVANQKKTDR